MYRTKPKLAERQVAVRKLNCTEINHRNNIETARNTRACNINIAIDRWIIVVAQYCAISLCVIRFLVLVRFFPIAFLICWLILARRDRTGI